jgi:Lon protease-like protein
MPGPFRGPADMPRKIPVFPLSEALLLPRAELPLNIFEPRYLAMIEHALSTHRLIGMVQPAQGSEAGKPSLADIGCAGRIAAFAEQDDGRVLITLIGVSRFKIVKEIASPSPWREAEVEFDSFAPDFEQGYGEERVARDALLTAFRNWLEANDLRADWDEVAKASNETLVNTLSMMAPYDGRSKQALLEAPDLKTRADVLIALTEISRLRDGAGPQLQ